MKIHHLKPPPGAHRPRTRKGRGIAAGKGKTAGRGTKGTGAHGKVPVGFEGGQMPLQRRLPKLPGFTNPNRVEYTTVNVGRLDGVFSDGEEVTPQVLRDRGLVRRGDVPVKVLGGGELDTRLTVSAHAFSASARSKIEAVGGDATVVPRRPGRSDPATPEEG